MSVGNAVTVCLHKSVSNTVGGSLEALDGRLLLVGIDVELDEQEQVTGQNATTKQGGRLSASAVSNVRQVIPVSSGEARVGAKVNCKEINHELGDLHRGQILLPPNPLATGGCVVVVIHENVDREVEADDDPGDASTAVKLGKAQESSDSVVVHMQESKWFLLQDEENGVEELEVLEIVVDNVEKL